MGAPAKLVGARFAGAIVDQRNEGRNAYIRRDIPDGDFNARCFKEVEQQSRRPGHRIQLDGCRRSPGLWPKLPQGDRIAFDHFHQRVQLSFLDCIAGC